MVAVTFNERLSVRADKALEDAIESEKEILAAGNLTFDNYRFHAGIIQGLRAARKAVAEANTEVMSH